MKSLFQNVKPQTVFILKQVMLIQEWYSATDFDVSAGCIFSVTYQLEQRKSCQINTIVQIVRILEKH